MDAHETRTAVRNRYAQTAQDGGCCATPTRPDSTGCCGGGGATSAVDLAKTIGYSDDELAVVPAGANLGLGCGNPQAIASIRSGETVLDLGSGAGFDCFLAARQVGEAGAVIGVDMTPQMLAKAMLAEAGFAEISITPKDSRELLRTWGTETTLEDVIFSAHIQAVRPQ